MNHADEEKDQPVENLQQQSIHQRLKQLSRTPRTGGSKFVKITGVGPISVIGMASIPPLEESPTQESSPDLSKEQLKKFLIDFLNLLADSKPPVQAPEQKL